MALTLVTRRPVQHTKDLEDIAVAVVTFELVAGSVKAQNELPRASVLRAGRDIDGACTYRTGCSGMWSRISTRENSLFFMLVVLGVLGLGIMAMALATRCKMRLVHFSAVRVILADRDCCSWPECGN